MNTLGQVIVALVLLGLARSIIMLIIGIIATIIDFKKGDF